MKSKCSKYPLCQKEEEKKKKHTTCVGLKNYTQQDELEPRNAVGDKVMILCRVDQQTTHTLPHW